MASQLMCSVLVGLQGDWYTFRTLLFTEEVRGGEAHLTRLLKMSILLLARLTDKSQKHLVPVKIETPQIPQCKPVKVSSSKGSVTLSVWITELESSGHDVTRLLRCNALRDLNTAKGYYRVNDRSVLTVNGLRRTSRLWRHGRLAIPESNRFLELVLSAKNH